MCLETLLPLLPQGEESRGGPRVSPMPSFPHFCLHRPVLGPQTVVAACHRLPASAWSLHTASWEQKSTGSLRDACWMKCNPSACDGGLSKTNPLIRRATLSPLLWSGCPVRLASVFSVCCSLAWFRGRRSIFPLCLVHPQCSHGDAADPGSPTTLWLASVTVSLRAWTPAGTAPSHPQSEGKAGKLQRVQLVGRGRVCVWPGCSQAVFWLSTSERICCWVSVPLPLPQLVGI